MKQLILTLNSEYDSIIKTFQNKNIHSLMLVCGSSFNLFKIKDLIETLAEQTDIRIVRFGNFKSNPLYESVKEGVRVFIENKCDAVFAVGGGSAIDVAKCIKLFATANHSENYLFQTVEQNAIPLFAMPTTAGSGSEATRYAIIYYNGEKYSVTNDSIIPSVVIIDPLVLDSLSDYQKKATALDALCHAVESFWSVSSTAQSREYSKDAIKRIVNSLDGYLHNNKEDNEKMLWASHIAGKAINITQTTAGHAMCYKLTGLYGIAHGHAAALCVCALWRYMLKNTDKCIDPRGKDYLENIFVQLAEAFGCDSAVGGADEFIKLFSSLNLKTPSAKRSDYDVLVSSVNPVRLKNNPVALDEKALLSLYKEILNG